MNKNLINGISADRIGIDDRGLRYGDGLFETIAFSAGRASLWDRHMSRLTEGCLRLGLDEPDRDLLSAEANLLAGPHDRAVIRIILTRGTGGKGYIPPETPRLTRIVQCLDAPPEDAGPQGLRAFWCSIRLADQPALAGLKHLNRLEQVLAGDECRRAGCDEGFLMNGAGELIEAIHSNVVIATDSGLVTPVLDRCGVQGVGLAWLMDQPDVTVEQRRIDRSEVEQAREWMVINSLRGIRPVTRLDGLERQPGPACRQLQELWNHMMDDHAA